MSFDRAQLPQVLRDLIDKQEIYENFMNYVRGQDRKELDLMKSAFWPEATDNHGAFIGKAHDFCQQSYEGYAKSGHTSAHYCPNTNIELHGDSAKCETAFIYVMVLPKQNLTKAMGGRYRDLCERRDGQWKILRRLCIFDWVNEFDAAQDFQRIFGFPDDMVKANVFPSDPIYQKW